MDRRQQKTRIAIYDALTELLKKKKFEDLTVQDIIDEANIGRSTFYSHFETKDQLLEEMCREMFEHVFSRDLAPESGHDFSGDHKGIAARLTHVLYHIREHKENISAILGGESEQTFVRFFREYLENAFDDVLGYVSSKVPKEFRKQFIIGSFVETVKWWIGTGLKLTPEQVVADYLLMLNGGGK
ncbi:MAG: TetR/AcrR family transcriptional regulator [Clostridiales bacterium]|nr:TetR/AcrR family transcriptional regulator [Clostridiales bacterium]